MSTAQAVLNNQNTQARVSTFVPWLVGGLVAIVALYVIAKL
jgi:hypothetical protein